MRIWQWVLGLLISALALYGAIRGLDLPTLWAALQAGNYGWVLPALLALTLSVAARAARWRLLLNRPRGVPFYRLWNILNVGYLVTHLLPFRMGELARVLLLARYPQTPPGLVAMSIVVEHVLDLVAVLMLTGLALALRPEALGIGILSGAGLGLTAGALLMLWVGAFRPNWAWRLAEGLTQPFPARFRERLRQEARAALSGLEVLRTPWALAEALGWSLVAWVAAGSQLYAIMGAFLTDPDWLPALWTMTALTFGMLVPSTPGYIGVVQGITVWVLGRFGIPQATAFSISVVSHALIYFYLSALGALGLWMETGSLRLRFLHRENAPHSQ
ncbi:lysylphosphatidylglycerol synthase transmembrane domain-containing protein [Thermoflexus sp.]|uniref:lysylphosphatidylglycerol synthase transmembrane domain-containing protein n=1 Tax=Thermoflexus sp. TaxID=1969742 RepID=UPI00175F01FC|nr:lysylphosphatidylglycerol synthase transmembrane domain-containing protein [Thermoflexus sp.]